MLNRDIIAQSEVNFMRIWDGNLHDKTSFESKSFLRINSCGIQSPDPGYTVVRKNGRKDWFLLLVCDGISECVRNGETYLVEAGNVMIFAPHEAQQYGYPEECTAMWIHFSGTAVSEIISSCGLVAGYNKLCASKNAVEAFLDMIRRFHTPGKEMHANSELLRLLYALSDCREMHPDNTNTDNSGILSVITYINTNYNKNITLGDLAKISGYSKSRFSHLFSEITGTTPVKYQNEIRLRTAAQMLTDTENTISDIAYACGFSDALYFSRIFKRIYGVSATEYRKNKRFSDTKH